MQTVLLGATTTFDNATTLVKSSPRPDNAGSEVMTATPSLLSSVHANSPIFPRAAKTSSISLGKSLAKKRWIVVFLSRLEKRGKERFILSLKKSVAKKFSISKRNIYIYRVAKRSFFTLGKEVGRMRRARERTRCAKVSVKPHWKSHGTAVQRDCSPVNDVPLFARRKFEKNPARIKTRVDSIEQSVFVNSTTFVEIWVKRSAVNDPRGITSPRSDRLSFAMQLNDAAVKGYHPKVKNSPR